MPDDLAAQMPVVKEILDLWGVSRMELAGYEADDLIGTLSKMGEQAGMDVFIFSGDHDDFQLISDKVSGYFSDPKGIKFFMYTALSD
jgi:DNA polymerase-1